MSGVVHRGATSSEAPCSGRSPGIDDLRAVVTGKEPVYGDCVVGYVTSAVYGRTIAKDIACAWLNSPPPAPPCTSATSTRASRRSSPRNPCSA
ncbi:glycine cleavage T C-terminal barrel domain-containing protein [Streptomyces sp. NPDC006365]|uniref:glycine cleavage T C-terminal barrel domain-containing protein n=1 Tax=Streptomyces sp. NPDC006365 TaxID=3364744 RepID=UPI0036ACEF2B